MALATPMPPHPTVPVGLVRGMTLLLLAAPYVGVAAGERAALWAATAAALATTLVAFLAAGPERLRAGRWRSPIDRLIVAGLALSALQTIEAHGSDASVAWLRQLVSCGIAFYALLALARRTPGASDALWSLFGVASFGLGLHAMWACTGGLERLAAWSGAADAAWSGEFALGKTVLLATLITAGRAREPGASPAWRASALVGGIGTLLHAALGGLGLGAAPLSLLEQPLYFSVTVAALLLLASLARRAWLLRRERLAESWRWRGLSAGFVGVALIAAFGGASGGEGLRMLVTVAAVTTLVAAEEPVAPAAVPSPRDSDPPAPPARASADSNVARAA